MKRSFLCFFILLFSLGIKAQTKAKAKVEFPKPVEVENLLFYVQRTINANTLVYTLNVNDKEELDVEHPIRIRWKNYAKDSSYEDLSYIQRKYAYGIDLKILDKEKQTYSFNFVSYKKTSIYLLKNKSDNKFHAYYSMKNELIILDRIFIQIEGGTFWVPKIKFIEVSGVNLKNEKVTEKIIP